MKPILPILGLAGLVAVTAGHAADWSAEKAAVLALGDLTAPPAFTDAGEVAEGARLKPIYFDALPWQGKETKVFAWLGLPRNSEGKVPGIVLVHGGGGSAFKAWVRKWNDAGFAAISIAVEGQTDAKDPEAKSSSNPNGWVQHEWGGPARLGIYGDSGKPLQDQWMYHAVADTILANSLLRSLPEVDADKVGIMGISWGGVITSTAIGIDDRFAFAIPTYGCGHLADAENQYGRSLGNNQLYRKVWDPMVRLGRAEMPVLWLSWPGDQHFPLDCLMTCAEATAGKSSISLIPGMGHGHGAGWNPPDSYAFAQSVVETGAAWCKVTRNASADGKIAVEFASTKPLDGAILLVTSDSGFTGKREWSDVPANLEPAGEGKWTVSGALPKGATAWILNVDSSGLTFSSGFHEVD